MSKPSSLCLHLALSASLGSLLLAVSAFSASAETALSTSSKDDEAIIVTIRRDSLDPLSAFKGNVALSSQTLSLLGANRLPEALKIVPFIDQFSYGGSGQTARLSIRGTNSDQSLILVDGVTLDDPSLVGGGANIGLVPLDDIDKIELLEGPNGVLWGTGALGGVISLTTKDTPTPTGGQLGLESGPSFSSHTLKAAVAQDKAGMSISYRALKDEATSAYIRGVEKDLFDAKSLSLLFIVPLSDKSLIKGFAQKDQAISHYDGFAPPTYQFGDSNDYSDTRQDLIRLNFIHRLDKGRFFASLGDTKTNRDVYDNSGDLSFAALGKSQAFEAGLALSPTKNFSGNLSFGVANKEMVTKTASYLGGFDESGAESRESFVMGLLRYHHAQKFGLEGGARLIDLDGSTFDQLHGLAYYAPVKSLRVHVSVSDGSRAPSLFQRFSDYSKPDLVPESAQQTEIGAHFSPNEATHLRFRAYESRIKNLIGFKSCFGVISTICSARPYGHYDNISRAKIDGFDVSFDHKLSQWLDVGLFHTQLTAKDLSQSAKKHLARTPSSQTGARFELEHQKTRLSLHWKNVSDSFDDAANKHRLKGFDDLSLYGAHPLTKHISVTVRGENLLNSKQIRVRDYSYGPLRVIVGIRAFLP